MRTIHVAEQPLVVTVTLSTTPSVNSLTFKTNGYILTGSTLTLG